MNIRLAAAEFHLPRRLRERGFRRLFTLAARAFGCDAAFVHGLPYGGMTEEFAMFTAQQSLKCLRDEASAPEVANRLRESAFEFGREIRSVLGLKTRSDVMRAARLLYRILGIDFRGASDGGIIVAKCCFARFYSPETCEFISALDEGILAGLAGAGTLSFKGRITGGLPICTACFRFPEGMP
jgi:hypothetical protein